MKGPAVGATAKLSAGSKPLFFGMSRASLLLMVGLGGSGWQGLSHSAQAEAIQVTLPALETAAPVTASTSPSPVKIAEESGSEESGEQSLAQAGYDFLEKGWVDDAIGAFQAALRQEPDALDAKLGLAIAYQRAGQDEQAWQAYGAVLEQDDSNEVALRAVGTLGSYRPNWQRQGIEALDRLLELYPQEVEAQAQRATLLGYQQRFEAAIADYEQLLSRGDSGQAPMAMLPADQQSALLVNAAQIYTYSEQTDLALPLFERYLNQGESLSHPASLAYATALRKQNRAMQAIAVLQGLSPTEASEVFDQRLALALAHQANGDPLASLATLEPLLNPLPEPQPENWQQRRAIANALVPIDIPPAELLTPLQSLLQDPDPVIFLQFRVAQIQLSQGDLAGAQASLLAYQASTDDLDLGTEFLLANIDQRSGNLEASAQRYGDLVDLTEGQQQWDALGGIAAIRFEQQRLGEAELLYRKLLSQRPQDIQARRTLAELMLARDKPKAALTQFSLAQAIQMQRPASTDSPSTNSPSSNSASTNFPGIANPLSLEDRQRAVRRSFLRRRGFQPRWERY